MFGTGSAPEVADQAVNLNATSASEYARERLRGKNLLRDDLGIPVFVVNSELAAIACYPVRQPDTGTFRYWESAGTCHVSAQFQLARRAKATRDELVMPPTPGGINRLGNDPLYEAAIHHMHRWLTDGTPPPSQPKIEFAADPPEIVRDEHGIAVGGIRLPQAEVPLAQSSAIPLTDDIFAYLRGSCHPFPCDKAHALHGDKATFLARFEEAAQRAVAEGFLLPRDVQPRIDEAAATWPE